MEEIKEILHIANKPTKKKSIAERATTWIGSVESLIVHTIIFASAIAFILLGVAADTVMLILTTIVSLEAIYLSIFIQMAVNRQALSLQNVEEDIDEIQADVKEIGDDVDELSDDIDEIAKDVDELSDDIDEISKDIDEIGDDVDELSDDVDEIAKDVDELSDDIDEISKDIDEIGEDVDEIAKDIDEIGDDIEDIQEHDEKEEKVSLDKIENMLKLAIEGLEKIKKTNKKL